MPERQPKLSESMRYALRVLERGGRIEKWAGRGPEVLPPAGMFAGAVRVTIRTMEALEQRGLVELKGDHREPQRHYALTRTGYATVAAASPRPFRRVMRW